MYVDALYAEVRVAHSLLTRSCDCLNSAPRTSSAGERDATGGVSRRGWSTGTRRSSGNNPECRTTLGVTMVQIFDPPTSIEYVVVGTHPTTREIDTPSRSHAAFTGTSRRPPRARRSGSPTTASTPPIGQRCPAATSSAVAGAHSRPTRSCDEATPTFLDIHQSDAHRRSQADVFAGVSVGDLFEWDRQADDCWVRYQVTRPPWDRRFGPLRKGRRDRAHDLHLHGLQRLRRRGRARHLRLRAVWRTSADRPRPRPWCMASTRFVAGGLDGRDEGAERSESSGAPGGANGRSRIEQSPKREDASLARARRARGLGLR